MNTPKELFQQNKELATQISAVVPTKWFAECLVYARAVMLDGPLTTEELSGAKKFQDALISLADDPEVSHPPLKSGIHHDLSIPVRTTFPYTQSPVKPKS